MSNKIYTIDEIRQIIFPIAIRYGVERMYLFGSYAKNNPTANSDIDIVIDSEGKLLNINFYGLLEEIVEKLKKKIDLFEISEIQINSEIYKNIKKEGVVIYEK